MADIVHVAEDGGLKPVEGKYVIQGRYANPPEEVRYVYSLCATVADMKGFETAFPVRLLDCRLKESVDPGTARPLEGVLVTMDVTNQAATAFSKKGADHCKMSAAAVNAAQSFCLYPFLFMQFSGSLRANIPTDSEKSTRFPRPADYKFVSENITVYVWVLVATPSLTVKVTCVGVGLVPGETVKVTAFPLE